MAARDDIKGPKWDLEEIPDLTGKVALVTGANSPNGIGFHTAHQLALRGAKVYIGARSESKALDAIKIIREESGNIKAGQLLPFVADMGDLKAVKAAAEKFMAGEVRLDILVNNAGLLARPLDLNANGISVSFNTNHLAPFVLTTTLLPLLERTATTHPGVRVIAVASTTHAMPPKGVRFNSVAAFNTEYGATDGMPANLLRYGYSKLANILFAKQLQKVFDEKNIAAVSLSLHPGGVKTTGSMAFVGPQNMSMLDSALSPIDGALTSLFAATNPQVWSEKVTYAGSYLMPFGVVQEPSEDGRSDELAKELWDASVAVVESVLAK